jgi:hypothetical protein
MKVVLKEGLIVLIRQSDDELSELVRCKAVHADHVLAVRTSPMYLPWRCTISGRAWRHAASP